MNEKGGKWVSHRIHVWYTYLHSVDFMVNVGKYASDMDPMGLFWGTNSCGKLKLPTKGPNDRYKWILDPLITAISRVNSRQLPIYKAIYKGYKL